MTVKTKRGLSHILCGIHEGWLFVRIKLQSFPLIHFSGLLQTTMRLLSCLSLVWLGLNAAWADDGWFQWSSTEIQYLHGDGYRTPSNAADISQSIITFTHVDGWAFGRNFMFMDTLISEDSQSSKSGVYGEAYSFFSLSKLSGRDLSFSIFKDLNATVGINAGEDFDSPRSGPRIALYGVTVDFDLPGFSLFSVDFLRHNPLEPYPQGTSWQITPVWKFPFELFGTKWSLEGFADFVGKKGSGYARNTLAQPQLRLDVGDLWGQSKQFYIGIEYQYWHNKYGIKGLHESLPQALVLWNF